MGGKMGTQSSLLEIPKITEEEIFLDKDEAKAVLHFFWPDHIGRINGTPDSLGLRIFAQQILILGVDASYSMGYIDATFRSLSGSPPKSIIAILKKLAKKNLRHWYKHATGKDLQNPKIYLSVRNEIARTRRSNLEEFMNGVALKIEGKRFYAHIHGGSRFG
jgi:hypothetical protein